MQPELLLQMHGRLRSLLFWLSEKEAGTSWREERFPKLSSSAGDAFRTDRLQTSCEFNFGSAELGQSVLRNDSYSSFA